jgi:serine/threonine protein kinase
LNTPGNQYSIYKPSNHQCCINTPPYNKCIQLPYQLKLHSTSIETFKDTFTTDWTYSAVGLPKILDLETKIEGYYSFIASKQNNPTKKLFTYVTSNKDSNISSGSFGQVLQYKTSSNPPEFIAVKYGKEVNDLNADIEVITHLTKNHQCSELLVKYFVYEKEIKCIIMERAGGTLLNLIKEHTDPITKHVNLSNYEIVDILYAVAIAIKCLQDNNLYYTDIKSENILFRNTNDGIRIILADLGSIKIGNVKTNYSASYFPYELFNKNTSPYNIQQEYNHVISWGIGILILDLLLIFDVVKPTKFINTRTLYNIATKALAEVQNRGHSIMKEFLINILFRHYTNRWSLEIIIEKLNILRTQLPRVHHVTKSSRRDSIGHQSRRDSIPPQHKTPSLGHDAVIVDKNMRLYKSIVTLYFGIFKNLFRNVYNILLSNCNILYSQTSNSNDIDNYLQSNTDITKLDINLETSNTKQKLNPICTIIQKTDYSLFIDYFTQNYINLTKPHHLTNEYNFNEEILLNINKNIDIIILNYIKLQCNPK